MLRSSLPTYRDIGQAIFSRSHDWDLQDEAFSRLGTAKMQSSVQQSLTDRREGEVT